MSDINHTCDKSERITILETKLCRMEKDMISYNEKVNQLDKTLDIHANINVRIESRLDSIEKILKEIQDERKQTKSFWREKGVGLMSSIITGITLAYLLIRFGLK